MSVQLIESSYRGMPLLVLEGTVKGEEDQKLQKKLESYLGADGPPTVYIDVSRTVYLDSHGLGIIIYAHKILHSQKRQLVIVNSTTDPSSYMSRLIEITNLDKVLRVVKALE